MGMSEDEAIPDLPQIIQRVENSKPGHYEP